MEPLTEAAISVLKNKVDDTLGPDLKTVHDKCYQADFCSGIIPESEKANKLYWSLSREDSNVKDTEITNLNGYYFLVLVQNTHLLKIGPDKDTYIRFWFHAHTGALVALHLSGSIAVNNLGYVHKTLRDQDKVYARPERAVIDHQLVNDIYTMIPWFHDNVVPWFTNTEFPYTGQKITLNEVEEDWEWML